jgi:colicin import membrane protein
MNLKLASLVGTSKYALLATILIAFCAIFQTANAQNSVPSVTASSLDNYQTNTESRDASERTERERINQERQRANVAYDAAKVACYQRFQVTNCLSQVRSQHNGQMSDLKRQEISLNDLQRKRRGAEQLRKMEEKTSPQRQGEISQQRGKALASDAKRQQRQSERSAPVAKEASAPKNVGKAPQARSSNAAEKQARQMSKARNSQERAAAAARAKVQNEERNKDAAAHAASVQARQKQNKKPPAASLPLPPN